MTKYKSLKSQTVQRTTKFHTMYLELIGQITWKPENIQNGPRMHIVGATPIWIATIASSKEPSNPWNRLDFGIHSTVPSLWIFTTNIYVCFHGTALYWCEGGKAHLMTMFLPDFFLSPVAVFFWNSISSTSAARKSRVQETPQGEDVQVGIRNFEQVKDATIGRDLARLSARPSSLQLFSHYMRSQALIF